VGKAKERRLAGNIREDIRMEITMMLADVLPLCRKESRDFNAFAIEWIGKNAAEFRKKWERYYNGEKEYLISN
jgi:hypothetical protein